MPKFMAWNYYHIDSTLNMPMHYICTNLCINMIFPLTTRYVSNFKHRIKIIFNVASISKPIYDYELR